MATTASSIRAFLDSLSQLPGSILVRNELSWQGLPPGNPGQILTLDDDNYPAWMGGPCYNPPLQQFDGSAGFFQGTYTSIGNKDCGYLLIQRAPFTGGSPERLFVDWGTTQDGGKVRALLSIFPSDEPQPHRQNQLALVTRDAANAFGCFLTTSTAPVDGSRHIIAWAFDGDAGTAVLEVDGQSDINTSAPDYVAPNPINLRTGAGSIVTVGKLTSSQFFGGKMGMLGMANDYIDDWSAFPSDPNRIFRIDTDTWSQWQAPPAYWSPYAAMDAHEGLAPQMTRTPTVTLVAK